MLAFILDGALSSTWDAMGLEVLITIEERDIRGVGELRLVLEASSTEAVVRNASDCVDDGPFPRLFPLSEASPDCVLGAGPLLSFVCESEFLSPMDFVEESLVLLEFWSLAEEIESPEPSVLVLMEKDVVLVLEGTSAEDVSEPNAVVVNVTSTVEVEILALVAVVLPSLSVVVFDENELIALLVLALRLRLTLDEIDDESLEVGIDESVDVGATDVVADNDGLPLEVVSEVIDGIDVDVDPEPVDGDGVL